MKIVVVLAEIVGAEVQMARQLIAEDVAKVLVVPAEIVGSK